MFKSHSSYFNGVIHSDFILDGNCTYLKKKPQSLVLLAKRSQFRDDLNNESILVINSFPIILGKKNNPDNCTTFCQVTQL